MAFVETLYLVILTVIGAGAGRKVLRTCKVEFANWTEEAVLSAGLGIGILAYFVWGIGLAGGLYRAVMYGLVGVTAVVCWRDLRQLISISELKKALPRWPKSKLSLALLSLLLLCVALNFVGTLAPISSSDALAYHFAAPKIWLREHRITEIPSDWLTYQPLSVEMLFLLGMGLLNDILGALFHWLFGVLIAIALTISCKQHFEEADPLLAAAVFYVSGMVAWESTSGFIDLGLTLYCLLAVHALYHWLTNEEQSGWLVVSGLFAGLAAASKYTGAVFPVLLFPVLALSALRRRRGREALRLIFLFCLPVALVVLPWYLKNMIQTGDPVFPFLTALRGSSEYRQVLSGVAGQYGFGKGWRDLLLVPFRLTFEGSAFDKGEFLGPLYLSFLPFSLFLLKQSRAVRAAWFLMLGYFLVWFGTEQISRFLLPVLPLTAVGCALGITVLTRSRIAPRFLTNAVVFAALGFGCLATILYNSQFIPVVLGTESREDLLVRKARFYSDIRWMNQNLPLNARILFGAREGYYLDREYVKGDLDMPPAELAQYLRQNRIDYIFCVEDDCDRLLGSGLPLNVLRQKEEPVIESRTLGKLRRTEEKVKTAVLEFQGPSALPGTTLSPGSTSTKPAARKK